MDVEIFYKCYQENLQKGNLDQSCKDKRYFLSRECCGINTSPRLNSDRPQNITIPQFLFSFASNYEANLERYLLIVQSTSLGYIRVQSAHLVVI